MTQIPYRSISYTVLTEKTKQLLRDYVLLNENLYSDFYTEPGNSNIKHPQTPGEKHKNPTGLKKIPIEVVEDIVKKDVDVFKNKLTIRTGARGTILITEPGTKLNIHKDTKITQRQCAIVVPLHPFGIYYSPTKFYPNYPADSTCIELSFEKLPALIDLQTYHSVENNTQYTRFNFQLSFGLPHDFNTLAKMIDTGTFLK